MKIQISKEYYLLFLIFAIVLGFRLFFIFQSDNFSDDKAYFHVRHIDYIRENLRPMIYDELSYGGHNILYPQFFHYLLVPFTLILPFNLALKLIPAILISLTVIIVYLISKEITKNKYASLIAALISGFIPLLINETLNSVSIYSLIIPLVFLAYYCLINIDKSKFYLISFIILSVLLPLTHPISFLFILSLIFYLILMNIENKKVDKLRSESILFSIFITLLIGFIIFKKAFLQYGFGIIWQNTPQELLALFFKGTSIFDAIYNIGIIPLIFGSLGIFYGFFREKKDSIFLLAGMMLSILLLFVTKLMDVNIGFIFLGICFSILSSLAFSKISSYITITKISNLKNYLLAALLILIVLLSILPSLTNAKKTMFNSITNEEIEVLEEIKNKTPNDFTILSGIYEGNIVMAVSERKNFMDDYFLLAPDVNQRLKDINLIYTTFSEAIARDFFNKYNINIIYISQRTKNYFNIKEVSYIENSDCFKLIKKNSIAEAYEITCI